MKGRYLEVTFRKGRPLAAYLYLPRSPGAKSARTSSATPGILVDYSSDGVPIGIELTAPELATLDRVNGVLQALGLDQVAAEDPSPLKAA